MNRYFYKVTYQTYQLGKLRVQFRRPFAFLAQFTRGGPTLFLGWKSNDRKQPLKIMFVCYISKSVNEVARLLNKGVT